jgi:hypothetical protein
VRAQDVVGTPLDRGTQEGLVGGGRVADEAAGELVADQRHRAPAEVGSGRRAPVAVKRLPTVSAVPVQRDLVVFGAKAQAIGQPADRSLQSGIVKRDKPPALIADHVVMVGTGGIHELVPRDAIADVDSADEIVVLQELEYPVDTGPGDPPRPGRVVAQSLFDLQRAEGAALAGEHLDQRVARSAAVVARPLEHSARVLRPL